MAETSSLLNCRRGNSTASSNLVLSANQDRNGCDESRNRFILCEAMQTRLQMDSCKIKRTAPSGAVAVLIACGPAGAHQDARAHASESCPPTLNNTARCSFSSLPAVPAGAQQDARAHASESCPKTAITQKSSK